MLRRTTEITPPKTNVIDNLDRNPFKSCNNSHMTVETVMKKRALNFTASFVGISGFRKEVGVYTSSSVIDDAWTVRIYPGGYDEASSGKFVSCFVAYQGTSTARAAFKLSVINQKGWKNREYVSDVKDFSPTDDGHGDREFINKESLKFCDNGIISNDSLAIRVDLMVYGAVENSIRPSKWGTVYNCPSAFNCSRTSTPTRNSQHSGDQFLDWSEDNKDIEVCNGPASLIGCLASLIDDPTMADMTIIVQDNDQDTDKADQTERIAVHKLLLCSRSPVFRAMLLNANMLESSSSEIIVTDITAAVMRSLIYYIYTGQCTSCDMEIYAEQLLAAASKYQIKELARECENYLCDNMTVKNASKNLFLGDLYGAQLLKEQSLLFIVQHGKACINGSFFETLSFPLCQEVIKCLAGIEQE